MNGQGPRLFVSAGEPSGDLHGAPVVRALLARWPAARIDALGGPRMREAGARVTYPMERLSAFGFVEAIEKIPRHVRLLRDLDRAFAERRYDLAIVIDYPGFHLRVAESAHRHGVPVLYYIAPQLWAWRPGRARRLARAVSRLAARGAADRVLGIFPGSRTQEIARLWKPFREAAVRLLAEGRCDRVVVAGTADGEYPGAERFVVHRGGPEPVLAAADAALAKSGTTTLEAALADLPMVVAYQVHPGTYWIARRLVTVPWISLVNLVAEEPVVEELLQREVRPERLAEVAAVLLDPVHPRTRAQREGLRRVRERLGAPGAADRVARMAAELLP